MMGTKMPSAGRARLASFVLVFLPLVAPARVVGQEPLMLVVPGSPWTLTLPKAGFELQPAKISPDGRSGYFMASDRRLGLNISFFVEPAEKCKTSRECRDLLRKDGFAHLGKAENVKAFEIGDVSVVECFVSEFKGIRVKQQNMFAEFVVDGYWVDAHISKMPYTQQDHEMFEKLVKSIAFVPKAGGAADARRITIFENRQVAVALPRDRFAMSPPFVKEDK
jgi:hypothetical protein